MEDIFVAMFYPNLENNIVSHKWYVVQIGDKRCNVVGLDAYWELRNAASISSTLLRLLGKKEGT